MEEKIIINNKEVDQNTIEIEGIDNGDYPDFCDAYVDSAKFTDGTELKFHELDIITDEYNHIVNDLALQTFQFNR